MRKKKLVRKGNKNGIFNHSFFFFPFFVFFLKKSNNPQGHDSTSGLSPRRKARP